VALPDLSKEDQSCVQAGPAKASTSGGRNDDYAAQPGDAIMPSLAERIYEETKTLPEPQALEVLDFIGYLKHKAGPIKPLEPAANAAEGDADWAEFEDLAGAWSGKFNRDECYDRPILR
jgi:hypothetical protein